MVSIFDIIHKKGDFAFKFKGEIEHGITGIFGPSGSGKTTFLHLLAGIEKPESGFINIQQYEFFNHALKSFTPVYRRKTGYVFQDPRLFPHLTVQQNLIFGYKYLKTKPALELYEKVIHLLEIENILDHKPYQLSGGQQQRVAIGRALLIQPNIIFLDEPFSNLDRGLRKQIISYLLKINRHLGIPMLVVSHDLEDLLRLTANLIIIENGSILAHDNYFNLCMDKNVSGHLGSNQLLSIVDARIVKIKEEQNMVFLETTNGSGNLIILQTGKQHKPFTKGNGMRVGIKPEDVALSTRQLSDISIQNQWKGKIKKVIERDEGVFCLIDCGFNLIAELTKASSDKLKLKIGKEIFCLVKSKGIDMIHHYAS